MHGSIFNNTNNTITISNSGSHCWYDDDLSKPQNIKPGDTWTFTTEDKDSGWCYDDGLGIKRDHYIKLNVANASENETITLSSYMTPGWHDHCTSTPAGSITINGGCSYAIVVNGIGSSKNYSLNLNSINLGKIEVIDGEGRNLKSNQNSYNLENKIDYSIEFSRTTASCSILDGNIKCNQAIGFTNDNNKIAFTCQQVSQNDPKCLYTVAKSSDESTPPVNLSYS